VSPTVSAVVLLGEKHFDPKWLVASGFDQAQGVVCGVVQVLGWECQDQLCPTLP